MIKWMKPALGALLAAGLVPTVALAVPAVDVVEAPDGFFVPTDAQKYDDPFYRGAGEDWEWQHGAIATPFTTAELSISAFDVDSCCGEKDDIYAMDNGVWTFLGTLSGTNDAWEYGNSFALGGNFFDDIVAGLMVQIRIDQNDEGWIVSLGKSVLTLDQGVRPPPTPGGVVPEPATWAMLITGFGFVGAMARRRRNSVLA